MTTKTDIIAAYAALTDAVGFGLKSAAELIAAGATWPTLHAMTDLGLMRIERFIDVPGTTRSIPMYRLFF